MVGMNIPKIGDRKQAEAQQIGTLMIQNMTLLLPQWWKENQEKMAPMTAEQRQEFEENELMRLCNTATRAATLMSRQVQFIFEKARESN